MKYDWIRLYKHPQLIQYRNIIIWLVFIADKTRVLISNFSAQYKLLLKRAGEKFLKPTFFYQNCNSWRIFDPNE